MGSEKKPSPWYAKLFPALGGPGGLKQKFLALSGTPHSIALGMAIGVFISMTPTIPLHTILCLGIAFVLRASKVAALMGSMLANPLTLPEFYFGSYKLGAALWKHPIQWDAHQMEIHELVSKGWEFFAEMITGGVVMGIGPAIFTYFATRWLVAAVRRNQKAVDDQRNAG
ncbi:MAG: DUF2062 domain-containing protein [Thermodesulfobacteriota bacterium]